MCRCIQETKLVTLHSWTFYNSRYTINAAERHNAPLTTFIHDTDILAEAHSCYRDTIKSGGTIRILEEREIGRGVGLVLVPQERQEGRMYVV